jgi:hypothetical protein
VRPGFTVAGRTTVSYILAKAAAACGLDKSTVRLGLISGTRDDLGVWHVEPAKLHRVFPPVERTEGAAAATPQDRMPRPSPPTPLSPSCAPSSPRQDRDQWREQAQRLALTAPKPEKPMTWWRWLRATG